MHQRSETSEKPAARLAASNDPPHASPQALDVRAHALFLDLDGTLAPIVERPELARVSADLRNLIAGLAHAMHGALALLTGRTISDADRMLGGAVQNIAGIHGLELKRGAYTCMQVEDLTNVTAARMEAQTRLRSANARIEDKHASIALHFRQAPDAEAEVRAVAHELAAKYGLHLLEGKMVIELLAGAASKAEALATYLAEPPFAGRKPVAVGDDITDEFAFAAANARGGFSVLVGAPRASAARYWLRDPAAVESWLAAALELAP